MQRAWVVARKIADATVWSWQRTLDVRTRHVLRGGVRVNTFNRLVLKWDDVAK